MRSYIKPASLAVIRTEVQRINRERAARKEPKATPKQLATWTGYSVTAIREAMRRGRG